MVKLHHICDACASEFTIHYDENQCEDDPHFCPFCGEMLVDVEDVGIDDE